jgi:hypothetical protein
MNQQDRRSSATVGGNGKTAPMPTAVDTYSVGDRVRVSWSDRKGVVVAIHRMRLAGVRVLLDGDSSDCGFAHNELVKLRG